MSDPVFIEGIKRGLTDGINQLKSDPVSAPDHYAGAGIECKEAMQSMMDAVIRAKSERPVMHPTAFFWWGCAFKYIWRWPLKNGEQDLKKCRQCLDYLIDELENKQ